MYRTLGAHLTEIDGVSGTQFAVWAPNAREVSVLFNANGWTPGSNTLYPSDSGIWTGFIGGMRAGDCYKFGVRDQSGYVHEKSDPFAFAAELRPKTGSVICDLNRYEWEDQSWMQKRAEQNWLEKPISVYEVQLGSWKRPPAHREYHNYRELAHMLVEYCQEVGYTHLQLLPITEHPFDGSWGYQTTGYFAPTSRFGTPDDFKYFVDYCHQHDIAVLVDWVPAHFPKDVHALGRFDGTACYEHADPKQGEHPDWGTFIFNYGRQEVFNFLISSAKFWLDVYHVDGLRVDAVASMLYLDYSRDEGQWVPNMYGGRENLEAINFLKEMNIQVHQEFPGAITVAEESTSFGGVSRPVYDGGLGFTFKWDMGWMNDTLKYIARDPLYRQHHQNELSFRMVYAFTENFMLPLSHDEVVHGKGSLIDQMPGDYWQKFANLRLLYGYQYTMPGKKLLFMGSEFAQWKEWNHNIELDWPLLNEQYHAQIRLLIGDLNQLYKSELALYEGDVNPEGFRWIQCDDAENSVFAYVRHSPSSGEEVVALLNFTPVPRDDYRIGVPQAGFYKEVMNTDAHHYGGSNIGNVGGLYSEPIASHGFEQSVSLRLPPLAMLVLKPVSPGQSCGSA